MLCRVAAPQHVCSGDRPGEAASEHFHVRCVRALEASEEKSLTRLASPEPGLSFFLTASHRTDVVHRGRPGKKETNPLLEKLDCRASKFKS